MVRLTVSLLWLKSRGSTDARELREATDKKVDRQCVLPIKKPGPIRGVFTAKKSSPSALLARRGCQGGGGFCSMAARSILSKHIPRLEVWSVSTGFPNYSYGCGHRPANPLWRCRAAKAAYLGTLSPGEEIHRSIMREAASIFVALRSKLSRSVPSGRVSATPLNRAARCISSFSGA